MHTNFYNKNNCIEGSIFDDNDHTRLYFPGNIPQYKLMDALNALGKQVVAGKINQINNLIARVGFRIINSYDMEGFTPLHFACTKAKDPNCNIKNICIGIENLLTLGARLNTRNISGDTPFALAVLSKNQILIDLFLSKLFKPEMLSLGNFICISKIDSESTLSIFPHELIDKILQCFIDIQLEENLFEKAELLRKEGNKEAALVYYRMAADDGDIEAIEFLYNHYQSDILKHIIIENAFEFCELEAIQGNTIAINLLGHFHRFAIGTTQSTQQAIEWYAKAAKLSCPNGYYNLGVLYEQTLDYDNALNHYLEAANCKHAGAQTKIGVIFLTGKGGRIDQKLAAEYLRNAVEQDSQEAIAWLSYAYLTGKGVNQSISAAEALQKRLIVIPPFLRDAFMYRMTRA